MNRRVSRPRRQRRPRAGPRINRKGRPTAWAAPNRLFETEPAAVGATTGS